MIPRSTLRTRLRTTLCAASLAAGAPALAAPPPPSPSPPSSPSPAVRGDAPRKGSRRAPCFLVALAYGSARIIDRDQTIRGSNGDVIQAGKGDVIIGGSARLAVFEIDLATGALRPRFEAPVEDRALGLSAAAIRGSEIALHVEGEGGSSRARIDLAARRVDLGQLLSHEQMMRDHALASDGAAYYRYCKSDQLCRGVDWEVRGNPIDLPSAGGFDAIALSGRELYGVDGAAVRVIDLGSRRELRRFDIPAEGHERGFAISGDEIVTAGRTGLARHDRTTGRPRGTAPITLPPTVTDFRLTCAAPGAAAPSPAGR